VTFLFFARRKAEISVASFGGRSVRFSVHNPTVDARQHTTPLRSGVGGNRGGWRISKSKFFRAASFGREICFGQCHFYPPPRYPGISRAGPCRGGAGYDDPRTQDAHCPTPFASHCFHNTHNGPRSISACSDFAPYTGWQ